MELTIHHKTESDAIASLGPVVLWFSRRSTSPEDFGRVRDLFMGPLAKHPKVGFLLLLQEGSRMPEMGVRKDAAQLIDELGQRLAGMFVVLLGSGFWASALRSVITGLSMLVRRRQAVRAYSVIDEAVAEMVAELPELDGVALIAAIDRLRSELGGVGQSAAAQ